MLKLSVNCRGENLEFLKASVVTITAKDRFIMPARMIEFHNNYMQYKVI